MQRAFSWYEPPAPVTLRPGAIVLVDMDEVVAAFLERVREVWARRHPHIPLLDFSRLEHWFFQDLLATDHRPVIESIFFERGFFRTLDPVPGAIRAVSEMRAAGLEVFFCSSPLPRAGTTCPSDKLDWLAHHFGDWAATRLILTNDKTLVGGDVLIDDKPAVEGRRTPSWKHVYFDRPYNRHEVLERKGVPARSRAVARISDWGEWRSVIHVAA